jgi:uncharacterized glyoxalase superfamily protein PhnB
MEFAMSDKLSIKSLTPVLVVDAIEPCLEFWVEKLGFTVVMTVPEQDRFGFAILQRDGIEIMYQTRASVRDDLPVLADMPSAVVLYATVADLDAIIERMDSADIIVPRRRTFYGADEIFVREPAGGHVVGWAEMPDVT